jgi:hypothetical protein
MDGVKVRLHRAMVRHGRLRQGSPPVRVLSALLLALVAGPALAQPPAATVTIDVAILDAKGQPVPGLGAEAIRVFVDDRPRTVTAVEFVGSGGADESRTIYIVIDQTSVFPGAEKALAEAASAILDRLGPQDRVGLTALPDPGVVVPPGPDTAAVEAALAKLAGRRSPELTNFGMGVGEALAIAEGDTFALTAVADRECRGFGNAPAARDSQVASGGPAIANPRQECLRRIGRNVELMVSQAMRASAPVYRGLLDLLTSLRSSAGSKAVVLLTGGLAVERGDDAFLEAAIRSAAAGATVHAVLIEPAGGTASLRLVPANPASERRSLDRRLDELTASARGSAQVATGGIAEVVDRLMGELAGFYRLTVAVDEEGSASQSGARSRRPAGRLRVDAGRGRTVRARPFLVPPASRPATARTPEERLADALRGGAGQRRDLPMDVAGYRLLGSGSSVTLLVAGHVELPDTTAEGEPPVIRSTYALFDERQQPVATGALPPSAEPGGTPLRVPFAGGLDGLAPGRYTLRVAATDGAGRVGSAERTLELRPVKAGDLAASDVLLGRVTERQVAPIAGVVTPDDRVGLQLDLRGPSAAAAAVRFLVLDRGGSTAVLTLPAAVELVTRGEGKAPAMATATAVVAPRLLPAGEYDVRAEISAGGRTVGEVTRPLIVEHVRAAAGSSGASLLSAALVDQVWALAPRFSRDVMSSPALLGPALDELAARAGGARARDAIASARGGTVAIADETFRREDPLAAAFLSGVARFRAGDLEAAAREFREAVRLSSEFFPGVVFLGACYAAGGKDREAAGAWQTALIAEAPSPAVHRLLIEALLRVRDAAGAAGFVDEVRERWPEATGELALAEALIALAAGERAAGLAQLDGLATPTPAVLFVAMSVLHEAHVSGRPVESPAADRARLERYAERYAAAGGTEHALVQRWLSSWR